MLTFDPTRDITKCGFPGSAMKSSLRKWRPRACILLSSWEGSGVQGEWKATNQARSQLPPSLRPRSWVAPTDNGRLSAKEPHQRLGAVQSFIRITKVPISPICPSPAGFGLRAVVKAWMAQPFTAVCAARRQAGPGVLLVKRLLALDRNPLHPHCSCPRWPVHKSCVHPTERLPE